MIFPLIVLSFGAIFYGFFTRDVMIGLGSNSFNSVTINYFNFDLIDSEFLTAIVKNIPFFFTLLGFMLSLFMINCFNVNEKNVLDFMLLAFPKKIYKFLNKK
jgi:hypothetical protein